MRVVSFTEEIHPRVLAREVEQKKNGTYKTYGHVVWEVLREIADESKECAE